MRETIIFILIAGAALSGYLYFKKDTQLVQLEVQSKNQHIARSDQPRRFSKLKSARTKGDQHNERKSHRERVSAKGKDEGAPGDYSTSKGIPSIYQEAAPGYQLGQRQQQPVEQRPDAVSEEVSQELVQSQPAKTLHGVPVQAWLRSHQNSLPAGPNADPRLASGVRVFVGCVEVNNHMTALEKKECEKVLAAKRARDDSQFRFY
jgi:hypothetical protein